MTLDIAYEQIDHIGHVEAEQIESLQNVWFNSETREIYILDNQNDVTKVIHLPPVE